MTDNEQQMNVRIDAELHAQLVEIARDQDRSLAATIRHCLKLYVTDWKASHA